MNANLRTLSLTLALCLFALPALATNAPSNFAATATTSSQVSLTWTDNATDEIGFTFRFDTNAAFTNPTYIWAGGANTTSYTHTGLSPAATYYYQIKAEGNPDSAWTATASTTTAPASLAVTPTSNSAMNLAWTANSGNVNITGYTYAYATNSSFTGATYVWVAGNSTSSTSRTGLATATTYWVKIKAEGTVDALDSPFGSVVTATTMPASVAASAVSTSQINVSWSGNSGNTNITGYTVAKATNSSFTGATYTFVSGAGATSYSATGLYAGTTYYFMVKAEGTTDAYDSPFTASVSATTSGAAPNPPSALAATVVSSSQINLTWTDNSTDETAFELKRATDSAFTQNVVWIGGIQGSSYSNTGLSPSTTYYYKVRAKGTSQDSAYSSAVSATTSASSGSIPNAPSSLTVTGTSSSTVSLSWTDNSSNETGFEVKRATDSGFTQNVVWHGGITTNTYTDTGLAPSTTYYYKVRAQGSAGNSAYSNSVSAATGSAPSVSGTPISPHFFGVNAWMPQQIGGNYLNGKLDLAPNPKWPDVQASRAQIMRYGGHTVDFDANPDWVEGSVSDPCTSTTYETTYTQYARIAQSMKDIGVEPVLQVPVANDSAGNLKYTPEQAASIVQCINGTRGMGVKYWSIGNEPDLDYAHHSAADVANYIKAFSTAMKGADSSIKIVGPETAWYDTDIIPALLGGSADISGKDPTNTFYYIDVISFHAYPFPTKVNNVKTWPDRAGVISKLMASGGYNDNLTALQTLVTNCNTSKGRTGDNALKVAVTEANINYENPSGDNLDGVGATSFLGGQFWAEMLGIAMQQGVDYLTFWSVIEGSNLGYLSSDGATYRPSYWHFQMMAENFRGSSITPTDNQGNVKAFASHDGSQIAVMILNEDASTSFPYTVRLDTGTVSGTNALKINVPAGVAVESSGTIPNQSSLVLVFDASGTLKKKVEYKRYNDTAPVTTTY